MRTIRAKVLTTGEEVILNEENDKKAMFNEVCGSRVFKADELEILEEFPHNELGKGYTPSTTEGSTPSTFAMMKDMVDSLKIHFWRDQRVEIVKILLRREESNPNISARSVVEKADEIIQQLKSYGD